MPFNRPVLHDLQKRNRADLSVSEITPNKRVLADVHAAGCHGLHGHLQWVSRQLLVTTCDDDRVGFFGALYKLTQKGAISASGTVEFVGRNGSLIPAGTKLSRVDNTLFTTRDDVTISSEKAQVVVDADVAGKLANTPINTTLNLVSPAVGVSSSSITKTAISDGADEESIEDYRDRVIARQALTPHGGAVHDYEAWALQVPGITRAWCTPLGLGAGTVVVRVANDNADPITVSDEKIAQVKAFIQHRASVIARVYVFTPILKPVDITVAKLSPDTDKVKKAVVNELRELMLRDAQPGAPLLISHIREAVSIAAGEHNHHIANISNDVVFKASEMPVLGKVTFV